MPRSLGKPALPRAAGGGRAPWTSPSPLRALFPRCKEERSGRREDSTDHGAWWPESQPRPILSRTGAEGVGTPMSRNKPPRKVILLLWPRGAGRMKGHQAHLGSGEATVGSMDHPAALQSCQGSRKEQRIQI